MPALDWQGVLTGQPLQWILSGFLTTLWVTLAGMVVASLLTLACLALRLAGGRTGARIVAQWVSLFRNTPLLVQLLFWYFAAWNGLPQGFRDVVMDEHAWSVLPGQVWWFTPEFLCSAWGLGVFTSAFLTEEISAGLRAISAGQREAALAQGFSTWPLLRYILLPQGLANAGQPGAVFIIGTGSQGAAWDGERFTLLGGWGFALSDQGSGAELGRRALRLALLAHEAMVEHSALTQQLMAQFDHSPEAMLLWTRTAAPADWAHVVPQIFAAASAGDDHAQALLQQTAADIGMMVRRLTALSNGRVALMGGLAVPVHRWLATDIQTRLVTPLGDALSGALTLARTQAAGDQPAPFIPSLT